MPDREDFLTDAVIGMTRAGVVIPEKIEDARDWLRTVWLAARGDDYGEGVVALEDELILDDEGAR